MVRMDDGFSTTYSFASHSTPTFWEKTVTPPGLDGTGAVETTTMRNLKYRTRAAKKLISLSESSVEVAYDPAIFGSSALILLLNVNQQVTVHWPDGHTLTFWGFLSSFKPGASKEGEQPTAEMSIMPTNQDNSGAEQAPVEA